MEARATPSIALGAMALVGLAAVLSPGAAHAACNLIPSATQTFRSTLGSTNKPFAAPGDYVEVAVRPARCDVASSGLGGAAGDHVVTVVFTPPSNGTRRVAFLTTDSCASPASVASQTACEAIVGAGRVACVGGMAANLALVTRNGVPNLSFRFPDTDALFAPDADDRTLAGPATIAVSGVGDPLPCALATTACAAQAGTIACIDDLYAADGTCQPNLEPTFPRFTALPVPNDYAAVCVKDSPVPCNPTPLTPETRYTVDGFGNLLVPFNWQGVLVDQGGVPVPRLMQATIRSPLPVPTPPAVNLGSFTPEGAPLPPIFEPNSASTADPNVLSMFGSVDAAYTILRLARRAGTCACGTATGAACVLNSDCPDPDSQCAPGEVRCPTTCVGGGAPGAACTKDGDCSGGKCGVWYPDFRPLAKSGGPLVLARQLPGAPAICQLEPHDACMVDGDCTGTGDPCVTYALEANVPVPLESLAAGSDGVFAFTVNEGVAGHDLNGDDDQTDSVVTLRDRDTGAEQELDGQAGCSLATDPTPVGRAVVRQQQTPFSFPAVETEGDVVAFLESEPATTPAQTPATYEAGCDENLDGDDDDTILRAYRVGPTSLVPNAGNGRPRAIDPGLVVDGRSLALSGGQLFFRTAEGGNAPNSTVRVGTRTTNFSYETPSISADGRAVAFGSADDLLPADTNLTWDVYVRDTVTNVLELVSATPGAIAGSSHSRFPFISADGRWVTFTTAAADIAPGSTLQAPVLRDRCVSWGVPVSGCTPATFDVGLTSTGGQPAGGSGFGRVSVSSDGRFVAYTSDHTNIDPVDTVVCPAYSLSPGSCPDVFVRDRCVSDGVAVPACSPTTEMVSVATDGTPANAPADTLNAPAISDDGNVVIFYSGATNFTTPPLTSQIFARDRARGTTTLVTQSIDGAVSSTFSLRLAASGDARYVAIESQNIAMYPGPISPRQHIFIKDRLTGAVDLASRGPDGASGDDHSYAPSISRDGRYVAYVSCSTNLVPGDTNTCTTGTTCGGTGPGSCPDVFVYDRATGVNRRVNVAPDGSETTGNLACDGGSTFCGFTAVSSDRVAFTSNATTLLGPGGDTNGFSDTFMRAIDAGAIATHDLTGDGDADDVVLQRLDTAAPSPSVSTLCPASRVSVAGGMTAFLRPEAAGSATGCPAGTLVPPVTGKPDLNADGDVADDVVHLWRGGVSPVENLHCAAVEVTMSPTFVAALVSEAGEGADLNGDADEVDQVVKVHRLVDPAPAACSEWQTTMRAAETVKICGSKVALLASECGQGGGEMDGCPGGGTDLNGDGDAADRVLEIWDPATTTLTSTQRAAEDFVCNDTLIAFRTRETAQCPGGVGCANGLNGPTDTDLLDDVLQVWDLTTDVAQNSQRAVRPCRFSACDPRFPYRVLGGSAKFLTLECDQDDNDLTCDPVVGADLNGDGDAGDLVISIFDVQTAALTVLGATSDDEANPHNPLQGGDTGDGSGSGGGGSEDGTVYQSAGRCLETLGGACTTNADCDASASCDAGTCKKEHRTCTTSANCPPGIPCDTTSLASGTTPASPDRDAEGVPDHLDNCPDDANGDQADGDGDGVGDACDLATCGNDVVEYDEQCDGTMASACLAGCAASCTCAPCPAVPGCGPCGPACAACANTIADPAAKVQVRTRNGAGLLKVKALLPLGTYCPDPDLPCEPLTIRLEDPDSTPIVQQAIGGLLPKGASGTKWEFKTKTLGVQKVQLKLKQAGMFQITIKSKRWFTAAGADDTAANTRLTLTIGTQCFTRAATLKID